MALKFQNLSGIREIQPNQPINILAYPTGVVLHVHPNLVRSIHDRNGDRLLANLREKDGDAAKYTRV